MIRTSPVTPYWREMNDEDGSGFSFYCVPWRSFDAGAAKVAEEDSRLIRFRYAHQMLDFAEIETPPHIGEESPGSMTALEQGIFKRVMPDAAGGSMIMARRRSKKILGLWDITIESPPVFGKRYKYRDPDPKSGEEFTDRLRGIMEFMNQSKLAFADYWADDPFTIMDTFHEEEGASVLGEHHFKQLWEAERLDAISWVKYSQDTGLVMPMLNQKLLVMALHELWYQTKTTIEEQTMAKNNDEKLWWLIEGASTKVGGLLKSFRRSTLMVVLDDTAQEKGHRRVFLYIRADESKFVHEITNKMNLTPKQILDAPVFETATCGILSTDTQAHEEHCNSCRVVIDNETQAAESAKDRIKAVAQEVGDDLEDTLLMENLDAHWKQNMTWESEDLERLVDLYDKAGKEAMHKANRHFEIAEKCRRLLTPDDEVTKLEKALEEAKRQQVEKREGDLAELKALI